ncbi:MAG: peptidoglycan DD-metalloendopeptidase family protein [bacterium]
MSKLGHKIANITRLIITFFKKLPTRIKQAGLFVVNKFARQGAIKAQKKTVKFFKGPMSDVSHLSIMVVIIFVLISGIPGNLDSKAKVTYSPFVPIETANEATLSTTEKRILEADSVATISAIYSDKMGQDASKVAEDLNNKINIVSGGSEYISGQPIVAMPEASSNRSKITKYVVQDGETVWTIARKFNITTDTVRYANKLEDENSVKPGQTLTILPVVGLVHTVSAGDSLDGIAARYKANKEMIIAQNDLYGEDLTPGMEVLVPDGEIPAAPKPVVVAPVAAAPSSSSSSSSSRSGGYGSNSYISRSGSFRFPTVVGPMGFYNGYHNWAIDIPNNVGTPIFAADSGKISEAKYGYNGGYGNTILIDHGDGTQTRYAHMSSLAIIGGYVSKGQVIGYMGSTGRSTGSHLHFEVIIGGARQNPMSYF